MSAVEIPPGTTVRYSGRLPSRFEGLVVTVLFSGVLYSGRSFFHASDDFFYLTDEFTPVEVMPKMERVQICLP